MGSRCQGRFHGKVSWESAWALRMSRARSGSCGGWDGIRKTQSLERTRRGLEMTTCSAVGD